MSDLKVELKRRNLPVSGSKPQLIERLKPFTESSSGNSTSNSNGPHVTHMGHILMDTPGPMTSDESSSQAKSPSSIIKDEPNSPRTDSPHSSEHDDPSSPPGMLTLVYRVYITSFKRWNETFLFFARFNATFERHRSGFKRRHTWVFLRHSSCFRRRYHQGAKETDRGVATGVV